jgi:hypothetical protein
MANEYTKAQQAIVNVGIKAAESFISADLTASNTKREVILKAAIKYAGDVALSKLWLEGFALGFEKQGQSAGTAKVRKAEANAVFKAIAKSEVSEGNKMQLSDAKGLHYNQWIELARELAGKAEKASSPKPRKNPEAMTSKQYDRVQETLDKASATQLAEVAEQAIRDVHKKAPAPLAGFNTLLLLQSAAISLTKNEQLDEFFRVVGEKVLEVVEPAIAQVKKAQAQADAASEAAKNGVVVQTEPEPETM